jgi:hypothetical protein
LKKIFKAIAEFPISMKYFFTLPGLLKLKYEKIKEIHNVIMDNSFALKLEHIQIMLWNFLKPYLNF